MPHNLATYFSQSDLGGVVEFTINGTHYTVGDDVPSDTKLVEFIRNHAQLKGTKFMCMEGGCGACIVSVSYLHPTTKEHVLCAVNSCLVPIFSCQGWAITTVEGLGSKDEGYNKIQRRLAAANGTQCGYCTPGFVMNMNSLLASNPKIKMKDVENSFGGNICRCTGYRPIIEAFRSLTSDAPEELAMKLADIEELVCPKNGNHCVGTICGDKCNRNGVNGKEKSPSTAVAFSFKDGTYWYRPTSTNEVFQIFDRIDSKTYRFIAGNTAQGVYRLEEEPEVLIDINGIPELHGYNVKSDSIEFGGNANLTEAMELFYSLAEKDANKFGYCKTLAEHIDLIANVPVRNVGTFAGNISMKHQHSEFPSDIFLILELVAAKLEIADGSGVNNTVGMLEYLATDMNKKLIVKIILPALDNTVHVLKSYKIMPRAQNAHAYVNAGFSVKVDKENNYTILEKPTILFGGINPQFLHATNTENYLIGRKLLDNDTLKGALTSLEAELKPDYIPPDATPEYRQGLALSLFYKFVLSADPQKISIKNRSGGTLLERPLSSAKQVFDTDKNLWPLNKPIPKVEALLQCAGEAEYTNDIPNFPGELWGQLVLCDKALSTIKDVDPSQALKIPGVVKFLSAKDIPGKNSFTPPSFAALVDEPIFADKLTNYAGQAIGVIVATSHSLAIKAAKQVKIIYSDSQKIHINMREIINDKLEDRITLHSTVEPVEKKSDIKYKLKGTWDLKSQYHYTLETQNCVAVPVEDNLDVYSATQWPAGVQEAISQVINLPEHRINMRVRRLGGGYGSKITRATHVGVVCSMTAYLLHRPVRMLLDLETNMEWCGKRFPVFADYEVAVNDMGEIQYLNANVYEDDGHCPNDSSISDTLTFITNIYDPSTWSLKGYGVKTDLASNSWCRAPGSTEAISTIETIMEHIANVVKKDPTEVRLVNLQKTPNNPLPQLIEDIKSTSDYERRAKDVEQFNEENRWKKRGITLVPMNYPFSFWGAWYGMVSIYGMDGSIAISHGGIEMGQGLNTKVSQVAAYILKVDLSFISIKPTNTMIAPNNTPTGGSIGSEAICYAVKMCCEELNRRLEPIRKQLGPKATWKEIINEACKVNVNLNSTYMFTTQDDVKDYSIYGVVVTEVEVDILTGQYQTRRVDILEDAGQSLSPEIDVGQVEGAFVMGLGYFTCEELVYQSDTGVLLTNRTWYYKPPGIKDIPVDFRVTLRKNAPNPTGVLRSKATGEPPFCLSCSVTIAIRNALESARKDADHGDETWFDIEPPFTVERVWLGGLTKKDMFTL